ncbi:hypothetical protein [Sphingomonas sp. OK281]|uniref:hypothetical protein n=1 Tax=Sphingomonas sp. OK281 TaxID=1881067 RepID=UPI000B8892BA|nr:hypothetical protein [Sphingomonas sp. OK281]
MKMLLFPATLLATLAATPFLMGAAPMLAAADQRRSDQMSALQARKTGAPSLREIESRVIPTMRGAQYLGSDYDSGSAIYTLKFLRDGTVIWVDVDGRNGQIVGRTGR